MLRHRLARIGPMKPSSGPPAFYRLVYRLVRRIPRGRVVTYGQVAAMLGRPRGGRAVGTALGALRGPLLDLVPWQRVIDAAGRPYHRGAVSGGIHAEQLARAEVRFGPAARGGPH